jgi:hypothetical protein
VQFYFYFFAFILVMQVFFFNLVISHLFYWKSALIICFDELPVGLSQNIKKSCQFIALDFTKNSSEFFLED